MTSLDRDLVRTIIRNSFWSTFGSIAGPLIAFVFGGLTIRYVGIEAAGFSTAIWAILAIAGQLGSLGIVEAAVPALAAAIGNADRDRVRRLVGVVLCVGLVSSSVIGMTLVACSGPVIAWTRTSVSADTAKAFVVLSAASAIPGALSGAMIIILRSASRYDVVTKITLPLSVMTGIMGCVLVPMFPSLLTVALVGIGSSLVGLPVLVAVACRVVPETSRPRLAWSEFPILARTGLWFSLTRLLAVMTGGADDLMIAGGCGAAALPPWTICKRLWMTLHTFLAQHVEHLVPTLGGVHGRSKEVFDRIGAGMHWYVTVVAAAGYTCLAWAGPVIVAMVAGEGVATLCTTPLFAFSITGLFWAMNIIPVISAMARSDSRPAFAVALTANCAQLTALAFLLRTWGVPTIYLAPLIAIPMLIGCLGASGARLCDIGLIGRRVLPVVVPLTCGLVFILASVLTATTWTATSRAIVGVGLAVMVPILTIVTEQCLGVNAEQHRYVQQAIVHVVGRVSGNRRDGGSFQVSEWGKSGHGPSGMNTEA